MAVSIDWGTKIITVPQADLTALGGGVYQLDIDWFRLRLKDLEDSEAGIYADDTHRHNTTVSIGTLTLARVVEIINGYTVTFEDGQYLVNLVGANSNLADVVNFNQVSIRSNNSAGLVAVGTSMTTAQALQLQEIWKRLGLDAGNPLVNTDTQIAAGSLVMTVTKSETQTTLTRQ